MEGKKTADTTVRLMTEYEQEISHMLGLAEKCYLEVTYLLTDDVGTRTVGMIICPSQGVSEKECR